MQFRKLFFSLVFSMTIVLLTVGFTAAADRETVTVEGTADIVNGRKEIARERAINNALRHAVEQAVGVLVESHTLVNDMQLVNDSIYAQSSGYIENFVVDGEACTTDACRVRLRAVVSLVKLEKGLDSLGVLMKRMGKPRLVMFLAEQNADQATPSYWWCEEKSGSEGAAGNMMMNRFLQKGFSFVDRRAVLSTINHGDASARLGANLSNETALKLMAAGEAEVVIIGQAQARQGIPLAGTSIRSCQATVSARAINADTGELLATYTGSAVAAHVNPAEGGAEALKKAAEETAEQLIRQITTKWDKTVSGGKTLKLIITGLDFADVAALKAMLQERIHQVNGINDRSFQDGTAKFDLDVKSDAQEIARVLDNLRFMDGILKVNSVTTNVIQLKITRG